jgi:hypothetical protein
LIVWVKNLPPESAYLRALNPEVEWGLSEQLLAAIFDLLNLANWQRAGNPNTPRPKPLRRPGASGRSYGRTDLDPEKARQILTGYSRGDYDKEATDGE